MISCNFAVFLAVLSVICRSNVFGEPVSTSQTGNNFTKFSCILVKSIAYGVQKAVKEYSLLQEDPKLSNAIESAEISRYLRDFCPENQSTATNETKSKENDSRPLKKVKRNDNNQHASLTAPKVAPAANTTVNNTVIPKNMTKKADELGKSQSNEFERFIKTFAELTEVLKSQLAKDKEKHAQHHEVALIPENSNGKTGNTSTSSNAGNKTEENASPKSRHYHSHKKHKNKSKNDKREEIPSNFDNLDSIEERNFEEHLKQQEKPFKSQQVNRQQEKLADNQNINDKDDKYIYLVPKNWEKRSISHFTDSNLAKRNRSNKKRNFHKNKMVNNIKNLKQTNQ